MGSQYGCRVPVYALGDTAPRIDPTAFVHPDAVLIGNVEIGAGSSVWPCAVLRGDSGLIRIGARTSIQDGTVIHCIPELPTSVGDECIVGHLVHLEGCTVESNALVGNGSVVLHRAVVRSWSLVGANAVVPDNMEVPSGTMALGVPAKIREKDPGQDVLRSMAQNYVDRAARYLEEMRRVD
jgi:carbonic anhydrase/acetyltransferase-like protein (isoleucine patch superfamily)